jgi:methylated-DNA-[protein]-cysteine S-methyltransferase
MNRIAIGSPVGSLVIEARDGAITRLDWGDAPETCEIPLLTDARAQLAGYFAGTRTDFDLPLAPAGSAFQRAVCDAMRRIPFGETRTYGEIAAELGASAQAVGNACGANPIPILIPCHRVLGVGSLGGYSGAGGIETKVALLRLEGAAGLLI